MSNRKVSSFTVRFFWPLMLCLGLGLGLMALVGLMSYRSDLHLASQNLTDATQYVKQQRTAYDRFNDTSVTKSLMRVIENAQQIDREIQYKIALTGEATLNTDDLRRYTYEQRLTGIILMNEHGVVQREYSTDGLDYAALRGYVTKDTVLGTAQFPIKTYTARIQLDDGSYVDLAAHGRTDEPGVIVVYYHTSAEYATDYNLIIQNLLEGYDPGTEETLVVTSGDRIIAANREGLAGQNVDDVPVLRSIRENAHGGEMTRVRAGSGDGEWVYCMLERGRDYYVYAYMPLTRALDTTPKNLLFTLVAYAMVLFIVIMIRWRLKHGYQEEQLRREQSYQQQLKDAARKAESANRAKTEFLQRMSHDIRTPINGIRGMVEIGDHYSEDLAKQAECRRKIWDASTLLLERSAGHGQTRIRRERAGTLPVQRERAERRHPPDDGARRRRARHHDDRPHRGQTHHTHWQPAAPEAAADEHFEQRHQVQQRQRFHRPDLPRGTQRRQDCLDRVYLRRHRYWHE